VAGGDITDRRSVEIVNKATTEEDRLEDPLELVRDKPVDRVERKLRIVEKGGTVWIYVRRGNKQYRIEMEEV